MAEVARLSIRVSTDTSAAIRGLTQLDAMMRRVGTSSRGASTELNRTGGEINRVGNSARTAGGHVTRLGGAMGRLGDNRNNLRDIGGDLQRVAQWGGTAAQSVSQVSLGFGKMPVPVAIGVAVAGLQALGAIAPVVAGIMLATLPAAFVALGAFALRGNKEVSGAFKSMQSSIGRSIAEAAMVLKGPLISGMKLLGSEVVKMKPLFRDAFAAAAPAIQPLVKAITGLVRSALPGLTAAMKNLGTGFWADIVAGVNAIGKGIGMLFQNMSKGAGGAGEAFRIFGVGVGVFMADLGNFMAKMANDKQNLQNLNDMFKLLHYTMMLLPAAITFVNNAFTLLTNPTKFFMQMLPALSGLWTSTWNIIKAVGVAVWNAMVVAWGVFWAAMRAAFNVGMGALQASWNVVWNAMKASGSVIWSAMVVAWNAFWGAMRGAFIVAMSAIQTSWNVVWNAIKNVGIVIWNAIRTAWNAFWAAMRAAFVAAMSAIQSSWSIVWNAMKNAAIAVWNAIRAAAVAFWNGLRATFSAFMDIIRTSWNVVWSAMRNGVQAVWNAIRVAAVAFWGGLRATFAAFMNIIQTSWNIVWTAMRNGVQAVWNAIRVACVAFWNGIRSTFAAFMDIIRNSWNVVWTAIKNGVIAVWNSVRAAAVAFWNGIKATFAAGSTWLRTTFWNPVYGFFTKTMPNAFHAAVGFIAKAWDALKHAVSAPVVAIVDVVYNKGIRGVWNAIATKFGAKELPAATFKGFATGGPVRGPGSGTSDSIMARLSNGEHVWTANEVRAAGGHNAVASLRSAVSGRKARVMGDGSGRYDDGGGILGTGIGPDVGPDLVPDGIIGNVLGKLKDLVLGAIAVVANPMIQKAADVGMGVVKGIIPGSPELEGGLAGKPNGMIQTMADIIKAWISTNDMPVGNYIPWAAWKSGDEQRVNWHGVTVNKRTAAMMNHAQSLFGGTVSAYQGSYSSGVGASAGTHDGGGAIDVGPAVDKLVGCMRASGFAAWRRTPAEGFSPHIHGIAVGDAELSGAAQQQVSAFFAGKNGLADNGPDTFHGTVPGLTDVGGSGVQRWAALAAKALQMAGLSAGQLGKFLALMQAESGGNPNAINNTDSNAKAGIASRGLMQVIPPTFATYHVAGTSNNIFDPLANMAAAANYIKHVYGGNVPGSPYKNGTNHATKGMHLVGEEGPEMVWFNGGEKVWDHRKSRKAVGGGYTVRQGDTLWDIAKRFLGDPTMWRKIYDLNKSTIGGNPNLIYPGQHFQIPGAGSGNHDNSVTVHPGAVAITIPGNITSEALDKIQPTMEQSLKMAILSSVGSH
jgi:nucleoid-associated protein YgaU